jgi:putative two-component system response regulator
MGPEDFAQASILVIDDEAPNVRLLERMLQQAGFANLRGTTDPGEALDDCREAPPDLVLLDLSMPNIDGFQILDALRELPEVDRPPVLVLTALDDRESRLRALDKGARDFLGKPFDQAELLARIRNLLEMGLSRRALKHQNDALEQRVQERTRDLNQARMEIVRRLGRAAEYRDNETGFHILRMSKTAALLGRAAGLSDQEADLLLEASPMHDVGKIGIPDAILLKPGKLDAGEWETMKSHTTIGAQILSGSQSELLAMAREIALTHHERWDGSGYPSQLAGEAIPFPGRVVAIADVFDALTSERPYKRAWSVDEAVALIRENRGTGFQPELVDLFLANLPEIEAIRDRYPEPARDAT